MSLRFSLACIRFSSCALLTESIRFSVIKAMAALALVVPAAVLLPTLTYASVQSPPKLDIDHCSEDVAIGRAIIQIQQGGNFSTGVIVAENRLLTVAHAVDWEKDSPVLANVDGRQVLAQPLLVYGESDLALFELETRSVEPLPIAAKELLNEETVWTSGFPLGQARTLETGQVSSVRDKSVVTSAPVFPGVSGGGLLRCDAASGRYQLAGIVTSYIATVDGQQLTNTGHSVSLRLQHIKRLMESSARLVRSTDRFGDVVPDKLVGSY